MVKIVNENWCKVEMFLHKKSKMHLKKFKKCPKFRKVFKSNWEGFLDYFHNSILQSYPLFQMDCQSNPIQSFQNSLKSWNFQSSNTLPIRVYLLFHFLPVTLINLSKFRTLSNDPILSMTLLKTFDDLIMTFDNGHHQRCCSIWSFFIYDFQFVFQLKKVKNDVRMSVVGCMPKTKGNAIWKYVVKCVQNELDDVVSAVFARLGFN